MVKKLVVAAVLLATLVITPYFLLSSSGPLGFSFGEREVRAAVEGRWTLKLPARALELSVELARSSATSRSAREAGWVRSAAACSHRTLVRSAEACLDTTDVELIVTVAGASPTRGTLDIVGTTFERARLRFDAGGQTVHATLSSAGEATDVQVGGVPATLVRRRH
jgi:hypothetical protein